MAEYIKRYDAMKICQNYSTHCFSVSDAKGQDIADKIEDEIAEIPTADVVEVKHGEFEANLIKPWNGVVVNWKCSVCEGISSENINYCPHCGAKMDGRRNT